MIRFTRMILAMVILCALLIWSGGYGQAESALTSEPIAHWTFDEGTGDTVADAFGNSRGTIVGDCGWVEGKIGGALAFSGGNYVAIGNSLNLNAAPDMVSISAWVMFTDDDEATKKEAILSKWLTHDGEWRSYGLNRAPGNRIIAMLHNKNVKQWPSWSTLEGLSANEWHHLVFTYKRDRDEDGHVGPEDGKIYIDGVEVNVEHNHHVPYTDSFTIQYCDTYYCKVYIGKQYYKQGNPYSENYTGLVDELAIWDVALDDSAIQELYYATDPSGSPLEPEFPVDDTLAPAGDVHAHDNLIWPANNKMVEVALDGYVRDELSIARDGEGIGVSSAYLLIDGTEMIILRDDTTDLLDANGAFSIDIEVKAVKDTEYSIELYAADSNPEETGGANSGLVDSTYICVPHDMGAGWSEQNADLNIKKLEIKEGKEDTKLKIDGSIDLPELGVSHGDIVESRTTMEIFGILPDGSDLVISSEETLEVNHKKHLEIKKQKEHKKH